MRIVQIIDSLHVGGAERMAVNYANALAQQIDFSGLVTTRKEGELKGAIGPEVHYLYLQKTSALDVGAILRLRTYCRANRVAIAHAHGTSFFIAFLLKLIHPKIRIVWHEHKGARSSESLGKNIFLWICSRLFAGIIVVDHTLEDWCRRNLGVNKLIYLPNFTLPAQTDKPKTVLHGESGKQMVCVANLRHPKNHQLLVEVAKQIHQKYPDWTFHFIGSDFDDEYSKALKQAISDYFLIETVYIYGLREDTAAIINQAEICLLGSVSEGLPVALLEYGLYKKAVVATNVGEIPRIISNGENGFTVPSGDVQQFSDAVTGLIENREMRKSFGERLYQTIMQNHSRQAVVTKYLAWLNQL